MSGTTAAKSVSISAEASAAPGRGPSVWIGSDAADASGIAARRCTGGSTRSPCSSRSCWSQYLASRSAESVHGDAGESEPVSASPDSDASTVRMIWPTPSEDHALGSVTMSARSAAKRPLTVRSPSEGGQSMMTNS